MAAQSERTMSDDYFKYIEYLQRLQIPHGWTDFFQSQNQSLGTLVSEGAFKAVLPTLGETDETVIEMARKMLSDSVDLATPFESAMTQIRYQPILNEITTAANGLGLHAVRPIDLVTSTDISCTPMARPTNDRHLLFAGEGTARF